MNKPMRNIKNKPRRLESVFQCYSNPVYFVTFNTMYRAKILDNKNVYDLFVEYALKNLEQGRAVGKFVIMPDHIHLFVRLSDENKLSDFVRLLKHSLTRYLRGCEKVKEVWQPGFFDHLLRNAESYSEKWDYVRLNPVRYQLVDKPEDWLWQGEITDIEF